MNDIATIVETNPVAVLIDTKTYSQFYQHIKAEVDAFEPDLSTASGRKQIASMAYKVTRTKTAIDAAGKKLNEDARAQINKVDEQRRKIRADLDALSELVRKPLTEWEQAEEIRVKSIASFFETLKAFRTVPHGAGSGAIKDQLDTVCGMTIDAAVFLERAGEAEQAVVDAKDYLTQILNAAVKAEADARELERLKEQEEVRQKAEREAAQKAERERLAKEAADRAASEAKRREDEAAEQARQEEKHKAEESIRRAEEEKRAAIAKAEQEKQELIAAQERAELARFAEQKREAEEQARRDADKKHRAAVKKAAAGALELCGCDKEMAKKIVLSIIAGDVPHVTMRF